MLEIFVQNALEFYKHHTKKWNSKKNSKKPNSFIQQLDFKYFSAFLFQIASSEKIAKDKHRIASKNKNEAFTC